MSVTIPTFEALTQFGTATVTTQNIGEVEASYSLLFDCMTGITLMEEQFFIMKPKETTTRSFKVYPTTDQAAKYLCAAILKDSDYNEVDRAECQFTTTATILDNGTIGPFQPPNKSKSGFFESIEGLWNDFWNGLVDFITGKTCRKKCSRFFDFSCHIQYICISWIVLFGLLLAIFPTVLVLLWLLHQKGLFDPLYDWWEDRFGEAKQRIGHIKKHEIENNHHHNQHKKGARNYKHETTQRKRRSTSNERRYDHSDREGDYHYYLHHVHKSKHKHGRKKNAGVPKQVYLERSEDDNIGYHRRRN